MGIINIEPQLVGEICFSFGTKGGADEGIYLYVLTIRVGTWNSP